MMSNTMLNPYQDFSSVRTPEMFFGRAILLRRIYSSIASKQCLSLVGTRHIGKSSILAHMGLPEVQNRYGYDLRHFIFVQLDLRDYRQKTGEFFFDSVSKHIVARSSNVHLSVGSQSGADQFTSVLAQLAEQDIHTVLLLDAFDNITHNEYFDLNFFSFLRAQARWVSYITASIAPLQDICRKDVKESPFFNIFSCHKVGPLTPNETNALITIPAERVGQPFTESEATWILSVAGRHPFFVQRVCHWLLEEKDQQECYPIDLHRVEELVYNELRPHFDALWHELSASQQHDLEAQMQSQELPPKILPELSESELFRRFVQEAHGKHFSEITTHITTDDIEDLLDNLDNLQVLGASNIRHLKIVSTRLTHHSLNETGRVIREILKEALEQTRGSGPVRQNGADDWRFYNILYFRYFHRKLKHDQIAARLEYPSTRSYYRDRRKALDALRQALLAMEDAFQL